MLNLYLSLYSVLYCDNAVLKLWLGLGTKDMWLGLEEDVFLALLIPCHLYTYNIPSLL